ncbi:MAG: hypothetical protein ACK2UH_10855, partial [Candidatus Promineifilaceae bacterium]
SLRAARVWCGSVVDIVPHWLGVTARGWKNGHNVAAAMKDGRERLGSAIGWLTAQVRPFFAERKSAFVFVT